MIGMPFNRKITFPQILIFISILLLSYACTPKKLPRWPSVEYDKMERSYFNQYNEIVKEHIKRMQPILMYSNTNQPIFFALHPRNEQVLKSLQSLKTFVDDDGDEGFNVTISTANGQILTQFELSNGWVYSSYVYILTFPQGTKGLDKNDLNVHIYDGSTNHLINGEKFNLSKSDFLIIPGDFGSTKAGKIKLVAKALKFLNYTPDTQSHWDNIGDNNIYQHKFYIKSTPLKAHYDGKYITLSE